jgi:hypothetical protein
MTARVKKIYKSGLKNQEFLRQIEEADQDKKPNILSSGREKIIFTSVYYGWLVAKYGINWESNL